MKKLTVALCLAMSMTMLAPSFAYASYGYTMPITATGSRNDLITIKRPESKSASTSDKTYTISATGATGTSIKIYKLAGDGTCHLVKNATQIGASGLYSAVVDLDDDMNTFLVYAETAYDDQVVRIDISKIKKSTVDKLKSVSVNILNFLK